LGRGVYYHYKLLRVKYFQWLLEKRSDYEVCNDQHSWEVLVNMQNSKTIMVVSIFLATMFILAQFIFRHTGSSGPWCSPSLFALHELGYPMYQFVNYGFPIPALDILTNNCSGVHPTTYEWSPIGLGVDGLLLAMLTYPLWARFLKKRSTDSNDQPPPASAVSSA
jgi:hypothetical protein